VRCRAGAGGRRCYNGEAMAGPARSLFLANVGARDLCLDGSPLQPARTQGQRVWQDYPAYASRLTAPILEPVLHYVLDRFGLRRLDLVILFGTDQPETAPEDRRLQDTAYVAHVLERWLKEHPQLGPTLQEVRVERVPVNPADYSETIPFFERCLSRLLPREDANVVFVSLSGGTPACNLGLLLAAHWHFLGRVQAVQVLEQEGPKATPLAQELLRERWRAQAQGYLARHDYEALAALAEGGPMIPRPWLAPVSRALAARLRFDFRQAVDHLRAALERAGGGDRAPIGALLQEVEPWVDQPEAPHSGSPPEEWERWLEWQRRGLAELFWGLKVKARQEEWVEFVARLFRMAEGMLRLAFEGETRHSTERRAGGYPDFHALLEADPQLRSHLRRRNIGDEPDPNTFVLFEILDWWVTEGRKGRQYGRLRDLLRERLGLGRDGGLRDLRNRSILAHGWQGISRHDIEERAGASVDRLLSELESVLERLSVPVGAGQDPFTSLHDWLLNAVEQA